MFEFTRFSSNAAEWSVGFLASVHRGRNVGWKEASFSFNRQKTTLKERSLERCLLT